MIIYVIKSFILVDFIIEILQVNELIFYVFQEINYFETWMTNKYREVLLEMN